MEKERERGEKMRGLGAGAGGPPGMPKRVGRGKRGSGVFTATAETIGEEAAGDEGTAGLKSAREVLGQTGFELG